MVGKLPSACRYDNSNIICNVNGKQIQMKECYYILGHGCICEDFYGNKHHFPDTIFPISEEKRIEEVSYTVWTIGAPPRLIEAQPKPLYHVGFMGDLGETGDKLEIVNRYGDVVRKIWITTDKVIIDAMDGEEPIAFPKNLSILYEPWIMDVGSYVFFNPPGNRIPAGHLLKLATEYDILRQMKDKKDLYSNTDFHTMHPYANYPIKFRRFFNNFMMGKTGNDIIDGMNWQHDIRLYKFDELFEKHGLPLPSFSMAKEVFTKYGYAPESETEEVEKQSEDAFKLGYDIGKTVAEEAKKHEDIESPEEAYANFVESYVTSPDYTNVVLPELRRLAKCGDIGSGTYPVCSEESISRFHILVDKFWHGVYTGIKEAFK